MGYAPSKNFDTLKEAQEYLEKNKHKYYPYEDGSYKIESLLFAGKPFYFIKNPYNFDWRIGVCPCCTQVGKLSFKKGKPSFCNLCRDWIKCGYKDKKGKWIEDPKTEREKEYIESWKELGYE